MYDLNVGDLFIILDNYKTVSIESISKDTLMYKELGRFSPVTIIIEKFMDNFIPKKIYDHIMSDGRVEFKDTDNPPFKGRGYIVNYNKFDNTVTIVFNGRTTQYSIKSFINNFSLVEEESLGEKEFVIKDSGARHENENGGLRDTSEGKLDYTLIPYESLKEFTISYTNNCKPDFRRKEAIDEMYKFINGDTSSLKELAVFFVGELVEPEKEFMSTGIGNLPHELIERLVKHYHNGLQKYGRDNWKKLNTPEDIQRFKESALRHLFIYVYKLDTDEDHLMASLWNVFCIIYHTYED